jgi:hypothetical protein
VIEYGPDLSSANWIEAGGRLITKSIAVSQSLAAKSRRRRDFRRYLLTGSLPASIRPKHSSNSSARR